MFAAKDLFFDSNTGGYRISRSVRLRSSATAYFNRTLTTPTNNKVWTWSGWVKRGKLSSTQALFGTTDDNTAAGNVAAFRFESGDTLGYFEYSSGYNAQLVTTQVFRDPSSWYHIVLAVDTTQATSTNRVKLYVNGSQVSAFGTSTYPSQNYNPYINSAIPLYQGAYKNSSTGTVSPLDGYLTEINFIDGQALTPSSFGATNTTTGVWGPTAYKGTYGTNGYYLNFSDNSGATATTIGKDYSGNGNNWTPNNISVTAGVTYDSMVDTPTPYGSDTGVGGEVRGNYAVLNPVATISGSTYITNGNLNQTGSAGAIASMAYPSTGKWYFEVFNSSGGNISIGIASSNLTGDNFYNQSATTYMYSGANGQLYTNGTGAAYGATYTTNDVIGVAVDAGAGTLTFYKNNTSQGTAVSSLNFANGFVAGIRVVSPAVAVANFGQRPFTYTAPSGFQALCTQNLPTPTIAAGNAYMDILLWTGAGQTGTTSITGLNFQPDFVWEKARSRGDSNLLYDSIRGPSTSGASKALQSNTTTAEGSVNDNTTNGYLSAFNSNGFSYFGGSVPEYFSYNGATYVAWNWKAGGSSSSNTSGSITSTVSVNQTAGFSVVTYTGNGTAGATVGHGLGATPAMMIVKSRSGGDSWVVYHKNNGASPQNNVLFLNLTDASAAIAGAWNNTAPSSSVITLGNSSGAATNTSSATYVAYCFAPIAGYSAFGSYTGNGAADGPFVYCGFRPRWVMVKRTDSTSDWYIWDTSRDTYNVEAATLLADTSGAETSATSIDDLSNGFKCRSATVVNASGGTYVYACFAENPFKYSLAR